MEGALWSGTMFWDLPDADAPGRMSVPELVDPLAAADQSMQDCTDSEPREPTVDRPVAAASQHQL